MKLLRIIVLALTAAHTSVGLLAQTTPLTHAIRTENFAEARKLISKGSVNTPDGGRYHPLTYAVYTGDTALVTALLKAGANPNTVEGNGKTALYVAAELGHLEIIPLLKEYDTVIATRQGVPHPLIGAVSSGSIKCLKALRKSYPYILDSKGAPQEDHSALPSEVLTSLLQRTINKGDNDLAIYLLRTQLEIAPDLRVRYLKNSQAPSNLAYRHSPLHDAATNAQSSPELIAVLIELGYDPMILSPLLKEDLHNPNAKPSSCSPRSPIELAAARGSIKQIRTMVLGRDIKACSLAITRAAYIAAFYNKKTCSEYLFGLLGEKLPNIKRWPPEPWLAEGKQAKAPPSPAPQVKLPALLPRVSDSPNRQHLTGTVAIISPNHLKDYSALLTVELGATPSITLVERDSIEQAIRENSLAAFRRRDSPSLHKQLDLIPAEHVILLSDATAPKGGYLQYALITTRTGLVNTHITAPTKEASDPEGVKNISAQLLAAAHNSATLAGNTIAVSLLPLKPSPSTIETRELANLINIVIPHHINCTPGHTLLNRSQIEHLDTEKAIGVRGTYWSSAWVIDGGIEATEEGTLRIILRATNPKTSKSLQSEVSGPEQDLPALSSKVWNLLAQKIRHPDAEQTVDHSPPSIKEATLLTRRARWLYNAGYYSEAFDLSNAGIALGDTSINSQLTNLRAMNRTLSKKRRFLTGNNKKPRTLHPRTKYYATTQLFGPFLDFARRTIAYLETPGLNTRPHKELLIVEQALWELLFLRTMTDDSIFEQSYVTDIQTLDARIAKIVALFVPKVNRYYKVERLLNRSHHYYDRTAPDSLRIILNNIAETSKREHQIGDPHLFRPTITRHINTLRALGVSITPWVELSEVTSRSKRPQYRMSGLSAQAELQTSPAKRREVESALLEALYEYGVFAKKMMRFPDNGDLDIIGCEHSQRASIGEGFPINGLSSIIVDHDEEFIHTAEFKRQFGPYSWLHKLRNFTDEDWIKSIREYRQELHTNRLPSNSKISSADWVSLREVIQKYRPLSPEVIAQFDLVSSRPQVAQAEVPSLQLPPPLILPDVRVNSSNVSVTRLRDATLIDDQLWISSYSHPPKAPNKRRTPHAKCFIHVAQLPKGNIQTIPLPDSITSLGSTHFYHHWTYPRRPVVADDYVYFWASENRTSSRLFAVDRTSLELIEIKLPGRYIRTMTWNLINNVLFISVSTRGHNPNGGDLIISVEGAKITETLVSNLRTPALSPLDHPDVFIQGLHRTENSLRVFTTGSRKYLRYYPETKTWEQPPQGWGLHMRKGHLDWVRDKARYRSRHVHALKWIQHNGDRLCFPGHGTGFTGELLIAPSSLMPKFHEQHGIDVSMRDQFRSIALQASPIQDKRFDLPQIELTRKELSDLLPPESKPTKIAPGTFSPNDLIRQSLYNSYVVGRWKDNILICLHRKDHGFPAVWMVKENQLLEQLTRLPKKAHPGGVDEKRKTDNLHPDAVGPR